MRVKVEMAVLAASMIAAALLAACDRAPASIPAREHAGGLPAVSTAGLDGTASAASGDPRAEPVPLVQGKPMWAANRRHTAQENARYQFARDGADFGAHDVDDFVAKTHAFIDHPPSGVEVLVRSNGDRLLYDPKTNVFAVVSRDGAPRTMFKPRDGAAYWDQQKQSLAERSDSSNGRRHGRYTAHRTDSSGDDQG